LPGGPVSQFDAAACPHMHTNAEASCLGSTATSYDPPPCKPSIRETPAGKDRGHQAVEANLRFKSVLIDFAAAH